MLARLLELIGIRGFYWIMSRLAGERMLPKAGVTSAEGWSRDKIIEIKEGSRYFLIANILRALVYIFPGLAAWRDQAWIPLGTMGFLLLFHLHCIVLEVYKHQLCYIHLAKIQRGDWKEDTEFEPPDIRLTSASDWYFAPKAFETELAYRLIGMPVFRGMVTYYIDNTRLTREDRDQGRKAVFIRGTGVNDTLQFVRDTRVAESIHLCAFLINVPVFLEGLALNIPSVAWFILPVLILDVYLVLLQRYNRLRMWPMILRARSMEIE